MLAFERPNELRTCLTSLIDSSQQEYELIVNDDGSSTEDVYDALDIAHSMGATVITSCPGWNQGQGYSLNRMFNIAKGNIIIKLDSDLIFRKGWLAEVQRLFEAHEDIGLLGLLHYYHDPVNTHKTVIDRYDDYSTHTHILGSGFAVRRECWEELGPFNEYSEAFAEDYEFQIKVSESEKWKVALPKSNLVEGEQNMGIGKSILVGENHQIHPIHKTPYLINSKSSDAQ